MNGIRDRLVGATFWLASAKFLSNSLSAISTIVLARLLVPEDFGIVALAVSIIAVAASVSELSLGEALINVEDPGEKHFHTVWTLSAIRGVILAAILAALARPLAVGAGDLRLEPVIYVLAVSLTISGMKNPRLAMLERQLIFRQALILTIATNALSVITSIVLAIIFRSYWALVAGSVLGQVGMVVTSYWLAPYRPRFGWSKAGELWRFSFWITLSNLVTTLNFRLDQLLVGGGLGSAALGLYTVGGKVAQLPGREVVSPLTATLFPAFSLVKNDLEHLRRSYIRAQTLVTFVALPISLGVAVLAEPLVLLLMGEKWAPAIFIIQLVASVTALESLGNLVGPLSMARGQTHILFQRNLLKFLTRFPLIVAGLWYGGLVGLLWMRVLAGVISVGIDMALIRRQLALSLLEQLGHNVRCLVSAGLMVAVTLALQRLLPDMKSPAELFAVIAMVGSAGLATFVGAGWLQWYLADCPDGAERELIELFKKILTRILPGNRFAPKGG